ncbi:recombination protein RecT [Kistimonas scapharcae]|uniref:Recombination protein RecT n=1 Tax=Kistimonas scapharcae TaxID=1036133 RepID=A0ABP8UZX2_9GAMM
MANINTIPAKATGIKALLVSRKNTIAQALEQTGLTPERLLSVVMNEVRKTPKLKECTDASLLGSVIQSAQLGLVPGGALGHCYLIPYFNRKLNKLECQFMLGYRGMLELARRSGAIKHIDARCVYEHEEFEILYGTQTTVTHKPSLTRDATDRMIGVYAVGHLSSGGWQVEYMSMAEIQAIRDGSKAGGDGPWKTHFDEMAKKTVIRRLFKYLPVSIEAQTAVGLDERAEAGISQQNDTVLQEGEGGVTVDMQTGEIIAGDVRSADDLNRAL